MKKPPLSKEEKDKRAFKKTNRIGRPPKLTDELQDKIVNAIRAGCYVETAVAMNDISKSTFYEWCKMKAKRYRSFSNAVDKAMAEAEARDILVIDREAQGREREYKKDKQGNLILDETGRPILTREAIPPNWRAAAWRLERKHSERWGRRDRIKLYSPKNPGEEGTEDDFDSNKSLNAKLVDIIAKHNGVEE